jgi:hypothetical protein
MGSDPHVDNRDATLQIGSRVVVTGVNDLQIYWQGSNTPARICKERTMLALRDYTAWPIIPPQIPDTPHTRM